MQYFSSGIAVSLCGIRFRVRVELEDDPDDPDAASLSDPQVGAPQAQERRHA
jgi:hypothetical protein